MKTHAFNKDKPTFGLCGAEPPAWIAISASAVVNCEACRAAPEGAYPPGPTETQPDTETRMATAPQGGDGAEVV